MNRALRYATTLCCLVLALAACDKPNDAQQPHRPAHATTVPDAESAQPTLTAADQAFIAKAAGDNAFQIALARTALQTSHSDEVRKLAQKIKIDHTRMNSELTAISADRNADHASPPVPVEKAQQVREHLLTLRGDAFDHAFAGIMVKDHGKAIELFANEAQQGDDAALRAFARKELPTLREHLAMARDLNTQPVESKAD